MRRISPRYELERPLRYRPQGEASWRKAMVINISRTGLVFSAPESLAVGSKLELVIELGAASDVLRVGRLNCQATVVRVESDTEADWNAVAAEFSNYELERLGASEAGKPAVSRSNPVTSAL